MKVNLEFQGYVCQNVRSLAPKIYEVCEYISRNQIDLAIDNSHYRLILKLGKEMLINHHS